jgi:hypothetical protein
MPFVPTVATAVFVLDHVPPEVASVSVMVPAEHNADAPVIADAAFTVIVVDTVQPDTPTNE